jgi:hypothetical protein
MHFLEEIQAFPFTLETDNSMNSCHIQARGVSQQALLTLLPPCLQSLLFFLIAKEIPRSL